MSTTCIDNSTLYLVNQNMGNHNIKFNEREREREMSHMWVFDETKFSQGIGC